MSSMLSDAGLHARVRDHYDDYYAALDDLRLEEWPSFFTAQCLYRIVSRENFERGFPLSTVVAESRGMLHDRVTGLLKTQMYAPRYYRQVYYGGNTHTRWCYARYRSYRAYDNTFQPTTVRDGRASPPAIDFRRSWRADVTW